MKQKNGVTSSRRKKVLSITAGAVIIVVLVAGFFIYKKVTQTNEDKTIYQYETVKQGTLANTVSATGNVAVRHEVDVNPSVSGTVKKVYVSAGDKVEKGDVLFTLSSDDVESQIKQAYSSVLSARQQVAQAQSSLSSAKAQLASASSTSSRASSSSSNQPTTQTQTTTSKTSAKKSVEAAQLGVSAANAQLASAQSDYNDALDGRNDLNVKAPCKGTVWTVNAEKGDTVSTSGMATSSSSSSSGSGSSAGSAGAGMTTSSTSSSTSSSSNALAVIAKGSKLGIEVSINESDINTIEEHQSVSVKLDAISGKTFKGTVDEISDEGSVSSSVVSYSVWVLLEKPTAAVKSGMTASVDIETSKEENVLLVSNAAVKGSGSNKYVLIMASGATTPTQQKVTTGTRGSSQTVIKSGLSAGQKIVTQAITLDTSGNTTSVFGAAMGGGRGSSDRAMGGGNMPSGGAPSGAPSGMPSGGGMPGGN